MNMCHAFKALLHGIFLHMVRANLSIQTTTQGGMNGAAKNRDRDHRLLGLAPAAHAFPAGRHAANAGHCDNRLRSDPDVHVRDRRRYGAVQRVLPEPEARCREAPSVAPWS